MLSGAVSHRRRRAGAAMRAPPLAESGTIASARPHRTRKIRDRPPTHEGYRGPAGAHAAGSRVAFCELARLVDVLNVGEQLWSLAAGRSRRHPCPDRQLHPRWCQVRQASVLGEDAFGGVGALHENTHRAGSFAVRPHWGWVIAAIGSCIRGQCALDGGVKGWRKLSGRSGRRFHHPTGGFAGPYHRVGCGSRCPPDGHRAMAARPWDTCDRVRGYARRPACDNAASAPMVATTCGSPEASRGRSDRWPRLLLEGLLERTLVRVFGCERALVAAVMYR